ncbi:MAG: hypothetical protein M1834_003030 [Cirrosporium novae-zelandiae]|nr:MAG: hypothetical protein M1834_003030 [Cirrosporium novae-zelandiae]
MNHANEKHTFTQSTRGALHPPCSGREYWSIRDPILTPFGEDQCRALAENFPHLGDVGLVVASPLRRALYTAILAFEPVIARGVKVVALPELQETSNAICDTGSDLLALKQELEKKGLLDSVVDLGFLDNDWNNKLMNLRAKKGRWAPSSKAVLARTRAARQWLKARPEKEIVVITHGGFLHFFTEDWTGSATSKCTDWSNTEFRSYQFIEEDGFDKVNATMVETPESRTKRGIVGPRLSRRQQEELYMKTMQVWEDHGLQNPTKM